ncbi:MAG: hypothetical protein ABIG39_06750 [Candidatus Micrarchaeota archaeon]
MLRGVGKRRPIRTENDTRTTDSFSGFKGLSEMSAGAMTTFTLAPRYGMPATLVLEETRSLLSSNGITHMLSLKDNCKKTIVLEAENGPLSNGNVSSHLSRVVSACVYMSGRSRIVNTTLLAMEPNKTYAPLFDMEGKVRQLYRPTDLAGATGAKYAALMVNLLDVKPNSRIIVPTGGYLFETIAGALCGHRVFVGDISPWVKTGREKIRLYTGDSTLELSASDSSTIRNSILEHKAMGIPLERLRNISFSRWNAVHLPFRNGTFEGSMFDPPFGKATQLRGTASERPVEAAVEFLHEAARVTKRGGPIVMRIPEKWEGDISNGARGLSLVGTFNIPKDGMTLIKFRKE